MKSKLSIVVLNTLIFTIAINGVSSVFAAQEYFFEPLEENLNSLEQHLNQRRPPDCKEKTCE